MFKKIASTLALSLIVLGTTYAQDKVEVQKGDLVFMVKIANNDASNLEALKEINNSKLVRVESNSVFYLTSSKDASESAIKEINDTYSGVEMKMVEMTSEEYVKQTSK